MLKITKWWKQATITFRLACEGRKHHEEYSEGPQTLVSYSEICWQKNWAWKCIRVVRWRACTSWCNYERGNRLRALCADTEKKHQSMAATAFCECVALFSGHSGSSRRGGRTEMKSFFEESWTVTFVCLASRHQSRIPSSTEKQVLGRGIMAHSIPSVPIPPVFIGHFNSIQFNSILFTLL